MFAPCLQHGQTIVLSISVIIIISIIIIIIIIIIITHRIVHIDLEPKLGELICFRRNLEYLRQRSDIFPKMFVGN